MPRRIAVLTTGRQDFGIMRSLILGLHSDSRFDLDLLVGGMHLGDRFGTTADFIREDGLKDFRKVRFMSDPPEALPDGAGALEEVGRALEEGRPEALVLLGDRSETLAAAVAASILGVPIVHLHGGEETEGAIDNAMRHAITKLSHLHFTTHEDHRRRVLQMGEAPASVHVVGPPGVDNLHRTDLPNRTEFLSSLEFEVQEGHPLVVITIHPTTLSTDDLLDETRAVAAAVDGRDVGTIITMPNADSGGVRIQEFWEDWIVDRPTARVVRSLGERRYWGLMRIADAMVSNSSSGLIEAPAAFLPVVNVGDRQKGRLRHPMTLDVPPSADAISRALDKALDPEFRDRLRAAPALYPQGLAGPRMLDLLADWSAPRPARKSFVDIEDLDP